MICAIMQPTYLPWLGYFDLIDQVDVFVLLDDVQFAHRSWQQRNRIKTPKGLEWLTVPVLVKGRYGQALDQVELDPASPFMSKHLRSIEANYRRSRFFEQEFGQLGERLRESCAAGMLAALNSAMIGWLAQRMGIATEIVQSSTLAVPGTRSELLVGICGAIGADAYLSPLGSISYLRDEHPQFDEAGVELGFHHYEHPTYPQLFGDFAPHASVVDLLLNAGPDSLATIRSGRRPSLGVAQAAALAWPAAVIPHPAPQTNGLDLPA